MDMTILPALGDNYIYLAEYAPGRCFAVDPGEAGTVLKTLAQSGLELTHILVTHHHGDHIGGIETLKRKTGCEVIGPDERRIGGVDGILSDGETMELAPFTVRCIASPGHTASSVCYSVFGPGRPALFTGDTLFVCGCGRILECDAETMYASLQALAALPDETLVYPGHDYTEENIRFALTVKPNDTALQEKLHEIRNKIVAGQPTVPSTLGEEKKLNPFLSAADWQIFARLRKAKDAF